MTTTQHRGAGHQRSQGPCYSGVHERCQSVEGVCTDRERGMEGGEKAISDVRDLMAQESGNVTDVVKKHVLWRREEASF